MEYPEGYGFAYIALIRKVDGKEVYSSPEYTRKDCRDVLDIARIKKNLEFYFNCLNSGIQQQLESHKLSEEQKKTMKFLEKKDYMIYCKICVPMGCCQKIIWKKEAEEFLK